MSRILLIVIAGLFLGQPAQAWFIKEFRTGREEMSRHVPAKPVPVGEDWVERITGMEFVPVQGGCFQMGDLFGGGAAGEKPIHEVCVDAFSIGRYEVTQKQWLKVMGTNPSVSSKSMIPSFLMNSSNHPVDSVSWDDAREFIAELNRQSGRKFRLPTEAEWEYACRSGGKDEKYCGSNDIKEVAWYRRNSEGRTHPVGKKQPNGLGLYDMSGNVYEWCQDGYDNRYYANSPRQNPQGPETSTTRIRRGGCFVGGMGDVRSSNRSQFLPDRRDPYVGFRLVMQQ